MTRSAKSSPRKPKMETRRVSHVGLALRRLRQAAGLTQVELAERAGLHRQTVVYLETGKTQDTDIRTLTALAGVLGLPVSELADMPVQYPAFQQYLDAYKASPWAAITKPTSAELEWVRGLSEAFWFGLRPTPEALDHLLKARRAAALSGPPEK